MSLLLINLAFAGDVPSTAPALSSASEGQSLIMSVLPMILIIAIFYFLMIRPQNKKMKEQQRMINNIKASDKVVTNSGIFGTVSAVKDEYFMLSIAENTEIKIRKDAVLALLDDDNKISTKTLKEENAKPNHNKKGDLPAAKSKKMMKKGDSKNAAKRTANNTATATGQPASTSTATSQSQN